MDNYSIYLVGGCVRDLYDDVPSNKIKDIDFVVEGIVSFEELEKFLLSNNYRIYHKDPVNQIFRTKINGDFADACLCKGKTITEDLCHRDFTMNAIAMNAATGEVIDPFNGIEDIKNKTISLFNPSIFQIDPTRILRAVRFAVTRDFVISPVVKELILQQGSLLKDVNVERKRQELTFSFKTDTLKTLNLLLSFNLIDYLFDESELWLCPKVGK